MKFCNRLNPLAEGVEADQVVRNLLSRNELVMLLGSDRQIKIVQPSFEFKQRDEVVPHELSAESAVQSTRGTFAQQARTG